MGGVEALYGSAGQQKGGNKKDGKDTHLFIVCGYDRRQAWLRISIGRQGLSFLTN